MNSNTVEDSSSDRISGNAEAGHTSVAAPLPRETPDACAAFSVYVELGPKRRYGRVASKVGVSVRTVRRWASSFNWKERIKAHCAYEAELFLKRDGALQREEILEAASHLKLLRDRQFAVAEALLDAAERFLVSFENDDLDCMTFADACRAFQVASHLGERAGASLPDDPSAATRSLRDQLSSLLDQAYGGSSSTQL